MNRQQKKALRKKLFVNRQVQGDIIKRSIFHWYLCTSLILLTVVIWTAFQNRSESALLLVYELWNHFSPAILASFFLLPIFIYDIMRASHRVAGPLFRLRREMHKLALGQQVEPLRFRNGDYWQELADEFNELAEKVQSLQESNRQTVQTNLDPAHQADPVLS